VDNNKRHAKGAVTVKQDMMFGIAMERCLTGWHDKAIEEEQRQLARKDVDQLFIIYQRLNAMRPGAEVHQ
jgi:hypothetical protein